MKDNEICKFREVLGIDEEIKVPEPELDEVVSVKTTAIFDKKTPKSQLKITR